MTHSSNCSNDTTLFKGFVSLTQRMERSKGGLFPYITAHTKPFSVIIIPIRQDGAFLIIKEMRYAVHKRVLSFPAGLVDDEEDLSNAAKRELLEETGYCSSNWSQLGSCYPLPGLLDQIMYIFVAREIEKIQEPTLDDIEDIETEFIDPLGIQKAFFQNGNVDANAMAALAMLNASIPSCACYEARSLIEKKGIDSKTACNCRN